MYFYFVNQNKGLRVGEQSFLKIQTANNKNTKFFIWQAIVDGRLFLQRTFFLLHSELWFALVNDHNKITLTPVNGKLIPIFVRKGILFKCIYTSKKVPAMMPALFLIEKNFLIL
jgi:hypothetical protein